MARRVIGISEILSALLLAAVLIILAPTPLHAGEEGAAGEGAPIGPVYVKLPPLVLPVFEGDQVTRQVSLVLTLQLTQGKTAADLEPSQRKLYDAFITELYAFYDQHTGGDRVLDPLAVKEHLQNASDRILGPGFVQEVLIQQAFERMRGGRTTP